MMKLQYFFYYILVSLKANSYKAQEEYTKLHWNIAALCLWYQRHPLTDDQYDRAINTVPCQTKHLLISLHLIKVLLLSMTQHA